MRINVGSRNGVKVDAVKEIITEYPMWKNAEVLSVDVSSGVPNQPKSLQETMTGAKNRAERAFKDCDYSVGIESGLMAVPGTNTGYLNIDVCAIYDGTRFYLGSAPLFEYPPEVTKLVTEEGLDINQAFLKAGHTNNPVIGSSEGVIGALTKGRVPRKECTKLAIRMALLQIENRYFKH